MADEIIPTAEETRAATRRLDAQREREGFWEMSDVDRIRAQLLHGDQLRKIPRADPLVENVLELASTFGIYGPAGGGKTFLALDIALAVAGGQCWHGHATRPGRVIYVAAEGAGGLAVRVDAWVQHYGRDGWGEIVWLPVPVNLFDRIEVEAFVQVAGGLAPDLIVFDTLARCSVGADENSARDMGVVVASLDQIKAATGATTGVVHHSGKNIANGLRGSSALLGAMDTVIQVSGPGEIELQVEKQRNMEADVRHLFRLEPVGASVVPIEIAARSDELRDSHLKMLAALDEIDLGTGVANSTWRDASPVALRTFQRHVKQLLSAKWCHNVGTAKAPRYALTDKGKRAITQRSVP